MEKMRDQEPTSLMETVRQMVACASRNRAMKFEVKKGCFGKSSWQSHNEYGKIPFTHLYLLFTIFVDFYIILFIKPNA
jgi:hypothetical protein